MSVGEAMTMEIGVKIPEAKASRMDIWGDGMMGNLPSRTKKRRKREASKKRRIAVRKAALL